MGRDEEQFDPLLFPLDDGSYYELELSECDEGFSAWLDGQLDTMEDRYREYWTPRSLVVVLLSQCTAATLRRFEC